MTRWTGVRRVLAIRLDAMGDVLMTTPALQAIRTAPGVDQLTLLTSPSGAAIAQLIPQVDEVIVHEAPWMKASMPHAVANDHALIERLAAARYDAAVVFTVFSQTPFPAAMLAYLAGIPRTLAHCRERAYGLISDAVTETEPEAGIRHEVQRHLDLVATVGWTTDDTGLSIRVPAATTAAVRTLVPPGPGPWAVVHPGSTAPSRRWPADYYGAAMTILARDHGWRFVVTGGGDVEAVANAAICAAVGVAATDRSNQLDLGELAALIGLAPLVIANNTGPAHLAAAMQTPIVDLYALTNPQHTPWQVASRVLSHDVACRWCYASICREGHHLCLRGVTPDQVVSAALALAGDRARAVA